MQLKKLIFPCLYSILQAGFLSSCTPGTKFTLQEANDYFKPTKNHDHYFTQGIKVGAEVPAKEGSRFYYATHTFYTPTDKRTTDRIPTDRPYAGYAGVGILEKSRTGLNLGVELGLVGPHAYGKEVQRGVHKMLGQGYPQGWDNQLNDEPTILLTGEKRYRIGNFTPLIGVNLGNLFTQAYTGGVFTYGNTTPDDYPAADTLFPRLPIPDPLRYYAFGGGFLRLVGRNIFLDGNTFGNSASVDKEPVVAEMRVGFVVEYDRYKFGYTYVKQTKEFETEQDSADFGEVMLGYIW